MRKLYTLLVIAILLVSTLAYTLPHKQTTQTKTSTLGNAVLQALSGINWTKLVHARLEIYKNGKLAQIIDPDPFTKNIELFFTNLAFFYSGADTFTDTYPITTSGTRVNIGFSFYSSNSGGKVTFYLSSTAPPSDIWNTFSLPSSVMNITQSYSEFQFNSTDAWFKVSGWAEAQDNYTIASIFITTNYKGNEFLLAVEPVNLTITSGDNVTVTWYVDFKITVQYGNSYIYLRNLAGLVMFAIMSGGSIIDTGGNTVTLSGSWAATSKTISVCSSSTNYLSFSSNPSGVCKSMSSYYSSLKNSAFMYAIFYSNEISSIATAYVTGQIGEYLNEITGWSTHNFVIMEVSNLNVQNNNEDVVSFVLPTS